MCFSNRWNKYFMDLAERTAAMSKDANTGVGCVVVNSDKHILSVGFNGPARGVEDKPERLTRPLKYPWMCHAEQNAVSQAACNGVSLNFGIAYVTHMPCPRCAGSLINAGITDLIVGNGVTTLPADEREVAVVMLGEADVSVTYMEPVQHGNA